MVIEYMLVVCCCFDKTYIIKQNGDLLFLISDFCAETCLLVNHLFKVALHGFVCQQQDGPHQISHQDEIPFGLQVQGHDVVIVAALGPQFLLSCPLVQTHLEDTLISNCLQPCRQLKVKFLLMAPAAAVDEAADTSAPCCHQSRSDGPR